MAAFAAGTLARDDKRPQLDLVIGVSKNLAPGGTIEEAVEKYCKEKKNINNHCIM